MIELLTANAEDRNLFREVEDVGVLDPAHDLQEYLLKLTHDKGIDFATAWLFSNIRNQPDNLDLVRAIDSYEGKALQEDAEGLNVVIVPGALYQEFPETGADGRLPREEAEKAELTTSTVPVNGMGTVATNSRIVLDFLMQFSRPGQKTILISICKGGADVKFAMSFPLAQEAFKQVYCWVNICGLLDGSPMVDWLEKNKTTKFILKTITRMRGLKLDFFDELGWGPESKLKFEANVPSHMELIHVAGFPLKRYLHNHLTRTFHQRLEAWGPNDGAILLSDVSQSPGRLYPVWGADHYMRPAHRMRSFLRNLFLYLINHYSQHGSNHSTIR